MFLFSILSLADLFSTAMFSFYEMLCSNGKIMLYILPNSLEYDENTSIIFRPNAKVMQCDLNLLFYTFVIWIWKYGAMELSKAFTVSDLILKPACSSGTYCFTACVIDAIWMASVVEDLIAWHFLPRLPVSWAKMNQNVMAAGHKKSYPLQVCLVCLIQISTSMAHAN